MSWQVIQADVREGLLELKDGSVASVVTSPPYWRQRDYQHPGQIGQEETPEEYARVMAEVFDGVRRVLRPDGCLWLNLGDKYADGGFGEGATRRRD